MKARNTSLPLKLSPAQRLLFWRIAAAGGHALIHSIHPVPKPALRRSLEQTGLINQDQVLDPLTGNHAIRLEITSHGWQWAQENMGGAFANSPTAAETLSLLLQTIANFLKHEGLRATDLFAWAPGAPWSGVEEPHSLFETFNDRLDTPSQMIDAALMRQLVTLSSGRIDVSVPIRSLRRLMDIHRQELDESLRRLHREGRIEWTLPPHAHAPSEEDVEAAFLDEYGSPVHHVKLAHQLEIAF